jgi:hypothetical protein
MPCSFEQKIALCVLFLWGHGGVFVCSIIGNLSRGLVTRIRIFELHVDSFEYRTSVYKLWGGALDILFYTHNITRNIEIEYM